jgi:hypothetical protein
LRLESKNGFYKNEDNLYQKNEESKKAKPLKDLLKNIGSEAPKLNKA